MNAPFDDFEPQARRIPFSAESEAAILGGLLLDNRGWDLVGALLVEGDFYRLQHQLVFGAVSRLINAARPADIVSVFEELQRGGHDDEVGGLVFLNQLSQFVPSAASMTRYAETVRELALRRKLILASDEIHELASDRTGSFEETLETATAKLTELFDSGSTRNDWESTEEGMVALLDRIQSQHDGSALPDFTPTGLFELDARLDGGMRGGELIVIGARPSMGKSALSLTIGAHVALHEHLPVGIFSMEMPRAQVNNRLMSLVSHLHLSRVKRGERLKDYDWPHITSAVDRLRAADISINDRSGLNINQLRTAARGLRRRRGKLGVLIVDYLGLMDGTDKKAPRAYQLEEATKGLKSLAKELNVPVILLAQLNRKVEERIDQVPVLSDLRDSGSIEQDADIVLFVHRPIKAKPDLGDEWAQYAKCSLAKVRDGEPGYFDLAYVGENTRFMDWPADTPLPNSQVRVKRSADL